MMHSFGTNAFWSPWPWMGLGFFGVLGGLGLLVVFIAILALKGYALWYAAKRDERWWFVIMLIINTAGILELVYLLFVVKKWQNKVVTPPSSSTPHGADHR